MAAHYQVYKDRNNQWRWRYLAANSRIIADSAEAYYNKADALNGVSLMKSSGLAPVYDV